MKQSFLNFQAISIVKCKAKKISKVKKLISYFAPPIFDNTQSKSNLQIPQPPSDHQS